jgi:hypothetical protein
MQQPPHTLCILLLGLALTRAAAEDPQVTAARGVIARTLGPSLDVEKAFSLSLLAASSGSPDRFTLATKAGPNGTLVSIAGTSGVAIASGFYHYLR